MSPLGLALIFIAVPASFVLLPRASANPRLAGSIGAAAGSLIVFLVVLWRQAARAGRALTYQVVIRKAHYVQLCMHSCVFAYWGWYWREVYHFAPLIVAQLAFAYALDMLVCWSKRDTWIFGFGPFPIVLSTNLFLWFRDDWFFLQFLMIAANVLGKEFITWKREGRRVHIFNPSAFGLFIFSAIMLATHSTGISWGNEIANTFTNPPHIYLEIFVLGLIVQALFQVTLVTLSAAVSLWFFNLLYTHFTGTYFFIDSNIPVAVFLGLHLLVTDPATSPRKDPGKIVFGGLYGAAVVALFFILNRMGAPEFYDKLLCVPFLNLGVRALDRGSDAFLAMWAKLKGFYPKWTPRQFNWVYMSVWVLCFGVMTAAGFMTTNQDHPGGHEAFWQQACQEGRYDACRTLVRILKLTCAGDSAPDCSALGKIVNDGRQVPRDPVLAGQSMSHACDLGVSGACTSLASFIRTDGQSALSQSCDRGDGMSCFILGSAYSGGSGVKQDATRSVSLFQKACDMHLSRGCARLGVSYLIGQGTAADPDKAVENFDKGCQGGNAVGCLEAAKVYYNEGNRYLVADRMRQACNLGLREACPKARK